MAWNEPGNSNGKDPWGNNNRGGNQGPPDLDQALKQLMDKLNGLFGGSGNGNGGSDNNGGKQG
ncbi:protease modulator HflK N-terminal domain-containing protein, partial [Oleiphilus sp. HI0066]|uniref:protease modulator HflK N-terminal domain-containing protein n=3 Tax=unclassified Oleiphilus TaxID=2631174 RepID=UPI000B079605